MLAVTDKKIALRQVSKYYDRLEKTGYVKRDIVHRFLIYLFLIDLLDWTYDFITDKDYNIINNALNVLFSTGNCLLPYMVFCANRAQIGRAKVGRAHYMGMVNLRITENEILRSTQDGAFRMEA